jgi:hypothetical protein
MKWVIIGVAALLSGCSSGIIPLRPHDSDVDHLERELSANQCVGNLRNWARLYFFDSRPWRQIPMTTLRVYNYQVLSFEFFQAGIGKIKSGREVFDFKSGRHVYAQTPLLNTYIDGNFRFAAGSYDLVSHKLEVGFCGRADKPYQHAG